MRYVFLLLQLLLFCSTLAVNSENEKSPSTYLRSLKKLQKDYQITGYNLYNFLNKDSSIDNQSKAKIDNYFGINTQLLDILDRIIHNQSYPSLFLKGRKSNQDSYDDQGNPISADDDDSEDDENEEEISDSETESTDEYEGDDEAEENEDEEEDSDNDDDQKTNSSKKDEDYDADDEDNDENDEDDEEDDEKTALNKNGKKGKQGKTRTNSFVPEDDDEDDEEDYHDNRNQSRRNGQYDYEFNLYSPGNDRYAIENTLRSAQRAKNVLIGDIDEREDDYDQEEYEEKMNARRNRQRQLNNYNSGEVQLYSDQVDSSQNEPRNYPNDKIYDQQNNQTSSDSYNNAVQMPLDSDRINSSLNKQEDKIADQYSANINNINEINPTSDQTNSQSDDADDFTINQNQDSDPSNGYDSAEIQLSSDQLGYQQNNFNTGTMAQTQQLNNNNLWYGTNQGYQPNYNANGYQPAYSTAVYPNFSNQFGSMQRQSNLSTQETSIYQQPSQYNQMQNYPVDETNVMTNNSEPSIDRETKKSSSKQKDSNDSDIRRLLNEPSSGITSHIDYIDNDSYDSIDSSHDNLDRPLSFGTETTVPIRSSADEISTEHPSQGENFNLSDGKIHANHF